MNRIIKFNYKKFKQLFQILYIFIVFPSKFFRLLVILFTKPRLLGELIHYLPYRKWLKTTDFRTIIDVGSYIGSFSFAMNLILPSAKIFSFEPIPQIYNELNKNFKSISNFYSFNVALGSNQKEMEFFENKFIPASSILASEDNLSSIFPETKEVNKIIIKMERLDDYASKIVITSPVLLKIDVQGYEEEVLKGGLRFLDKVDVVILEVSYIALYKNQSTFDSIYTLLKKNEFEYKGSLDSTISNLDGTILQSDIIFVRKKN
jgi:FkbM family methyltransferase